MKDKLQIVFFGTPDFAVPSLDILLKNGFEVVGVVTSEDKPAGRGLSLRESAVKIYSNKNNLKILQPTKLRNSDFVATLQEMNPDLNVVVAFRKLPEMIWQLPTLGTINLHASLLPNYRGAAPINRVIINGEKDTGVTTFFINEAIDTGDLIYQDKVSIEDDETAGELHDKLSRIGAETLLKTVIGIQDGNNPRIKQVQNAEQRNAPKIAKKDCEINWKLDLREVHNFIRGLSPYPCAWTLLEGKIFKIYKSLAEQEEHNLPQGKILTDKNNYFKVALKEGFLSLEEVQSEGKKKMKIAEFLKGANISEDIVFN